MADTRPRRVTVALIGVAVALVTATSTTAGATTTAAGSAPRGPVGWWSAGDSYSSGEGIPGNRGGCAQSQLAWGPAAARLLRDGEGGTRWDIPDPVVFSACTGHLVDDLYVRNDPDEGSLWEWAVEQAGSDDPRFDVITMTFGGNDLGFSDILVDCNAWLEAPGGPSWTDLLRGPGRGRCEVSEDELRTRVAAMTADAAHDGAAKCAAFGACATPTDRFTIDDGGAGGTGRAVTGSLADLYTTVVRNHLTSRGSLVVVGYPRLFAPSGEWAWVYGLRCAGFRRDDTNMLGRVAEYLDTVIHQQVNLANEQLGADRVTFVSAVDLFGGREGARDAGDGHELCGNGPDWLNGWWVDGSGTRADASFHPHAVGHAAEARAVADRLRAHDWDRGPQRPQLPDGWRWLEVPGAAVGIPPELEVADAARHADLPFPASRASASAPDAFLYEVTIAPLTVVDPASGQDVAVASIAGYRDHLEHVYALDPELGDVNGGLPSFETVRRTGDLNVMRTGAVSGSGDVSTSTWLVEVPSGGVVQVTVDIYVEDLLGPYGDVPVERYQDTIWVDPDAWAGPTQTSDGPFFHPLADDFRFNIRGVGLVEAGMTLAQAQQLTGQRWIISNFDTFDGYCYFAGVEGVDTYGFLVTNDDPDRGPWQGRIGFVTTDAWNGPYTSTLSGIHPGSTIEEVRAAYGDALVESPHAYDEHGVYLDLFGHDEDDGFGIRFDIDDDQRVAAINAGSADKIVYVEGCA